MSYSQNQEDIKIADYFNGKIGNLLSVGENNGTMLSNAKLLIELGWSAWLLEPASVCADLFLLHKDNPKVHVFNYGLGLKDERVKFYESENHVPGGSDIALVSSTDYNETVRWREAGVKFNEREIQLVSFEKFWNVADKPKFDFISIDCEGNDWNVLQQINLSEVECKALVIEWNGNRELKYKFRTYCSQFGLKLIHKNAENLIFAL